MNQIKNYKEYIKSAYAKELRNGKSFEDLAALPAAKKYWEKLQNEYAEENKIETKKQSFIKNAINILGKEKVIDSFLNAGSNQAKAIKVINNEGSYNSIEKEEIEYQLSIN